MEKANATIKVDSAENWGKAKNYIPDNFTIIVYTYPEGAPRIKMGDGIHTVPSLPFLVSNQVVEEDTLIL